CRRFSHIVGVPLIRYSESKDLGTIQTFALLVKGIGHTTDDESRHLAIDVSCKLDQPRLTTFHSRLPGQIIRVDWNAVTTQTRAWIKRHKAERFRFRRFNDLPNIDTEGMASERHLVGKRNVHAAKRILEKLHHFSAIC